MCFIAFTEHDFVSFFRREAIAGNINIAKNVAVVFSVAPINVLSSPIVLNLFILAHFLDETTADIEINLGFYWMHSSH